MILILVTEISPRVKYTFELLFQLILKVNCTLTTNSAEFQKFAGAKFIYSKDSIDGALHFGAAELLFERNIKQPYLEVINQGEETIFYSVSIGVLNFDPFACTFYLVSRYEEYLHHNKDRHERYLSEESTAFTSGFLDKPMVNIWAQKIKSIITSHFPEFEFPALVFSFTPTIDIDNAYAFRFKGIIRSTAAWAGELLNFDYQKLKRRALVQLGFLKDPYDTYENQDLIHKRNNVNPLYFILLGNYGKYDKNLSYKHPKYRSLIRKIEKNSEVCLHPSYGSANKKGQILIEKKRIERIVKRPVVKSRHHFIKIKLPDTYRNLIDAGFEEDYSMGYPDKVGYRASIATPFYFYDLVNEQQTNLKIFPFVVMDVTLKKYLHIKSKDVTSFLTPIIEENKKIGGHFIFIFHNESMSGEKMWKNWTDLYEKLIQISNN